MPLPYLSFLVGVIHDTPKKHRVKRDTVTLNVTVSRLTRCFLGDEISKLTRVTSRFLVTPSLRRHGNKKTAWCGFVLKKKIVARRVPYSQNVVLGVLVKLVRARLLSRPFRLEPKE